MAKTNRQLLSHGTKVYASKKQKFGVDEVKFDRSARE